MKYVKICMLAVLTIPAIAFAQKLDKTASSILQQKGKNSSSKTTKNNTATSNTAVTQQEAATGIKQALSNGLMSSINALSVKDGFLGNAAVKILMPAEAQKIEKTLRTVGMGALCDQFINSLNRAAESAVKEAAPVFVSALSQMTVTDAFQILLGTQTDAATNYFKRTTTATLTEKFSPIVASALGQNNVSTYWTQLTSAYNNIPLTSTKVQTDLNAYVTQKAIDGLFIKVADEEAKVRTNTGNARNSALLTKVFGWADKQK
ncbi:DUF4197 domain-containing protein [Sphingobacterium sp. Mn56C]|uniref:DUF4197 domain-containing protein n=1 Tax=Sphingobacterium sp. Mn56C TaxID=3395261 RepID=UPI003BE05A43